MNNTMISNGDMSVVDMAMNVRTSILTISNASFSDSGMYYCEAESSEFVDLNVTSGIANIGVVGKLVNDIILCYTINYVYSHTQIRIHKQYVLMLNAHCIYYTHAHIHMDTLSCTHTHTHTHTHTRTHTYIHMHKHGTHLTYIIHTCTRQYTHAYIQCKSAQLVISS